MRTRPLRFAFTFLAVFALLTFTASSGNADLDPADGSDVVALNWQGESPSPQGGTSDGSLPLWANLALGALLLACGARQVARMEGRSG